MTQSELDEVLRAHGLWLLNKGGDAPNLVDKDLRGLRLSHADLTRVDCTDARLRWSDLTGTNFTGANLTRANFYFSKLVNADFTDADLTGANLSATNLTGADLTRAKGLPVIRPVAGFRASLLAAVTADGCGLKMASWHTCETSHCLAGWVVAVHPEGKLLESIYATSTAAALILNACGEKVPNFYDARNGSVERALNWLRTGNQLDTCEVD